MDDVFVYIIDINGKTNEMITPCADGYTVYIDDKLSPQGKLDAYLHAVKHLDDFGSDASADELEQKAHGVSR